MKSYTIKVYEPDGTYLTTVNDQLRLSKIRFRSTVNGGQGNLSVKIKSEFDDPPSWAALNNFFKIYCIKLENKVQTEQLVFSGFISRVEHVREGSKEYMEISTMSLAGLLGLALFKSGASFDVTKSTVDPSTIATDIISAVNTAIGTSWLSSGANIDSVGTNVSYVFKKMRWLASMQKSLELAGGDFYWFIGADGELYFKQIPSTATHSFNILKHVNSVRVVNSSEKIVNDSTVSYSGTKNATDATSITNYFKRDEWQEDTDLDANAAQQFVDGRVADNKDPVIQVKCEINSSYNIETIKPGDTCKFYGTKIGSTVLGTNMVVVSVDYDETNVVLTLGDEFQNFGTELTKYLGNQLLEKQL
jgi:hypothetical protein